MDFILRLLIRGYPESMDAAMRSRAGKMAGFAGIATNILLFIIKLLGGLISGSIAMLADAVNNLTDSASSIITIIGFKLAEKPADDGHPFGHARMEYISGVVISFVMVFLGFQFGMSSFEKILTPEYTEYSAAVMVILILSILIKIWQSLFYRAVGRRIGSQALIATATDSRNDVVSTLAILLGAVISLITSLRLDGYIGLLVAVFITVSGVRLIIETANPLLGTAPDAGLIKGIHDKIRAYKGVIGMHDLTIHNYGEGKCFASVHCEVPAEENILVSHDIIDNIERDFLRDMDIHMVIHLDPVVTSDARTNALREDIMASVAQLYPTFSVHDFRVVWGISHSNIVFDVAVPFSETDTDRRISERIKEMIREKDDAYRVVLTIDRVSQVSMDFSQD